MNSEDSFGEERLRIVNKIVVSWKEHVLFPKETHTKFIEDGPCKPWLYISVTIPAPRGFPLQTISLYCFALILALQYPLWGNASEISWLCLGRTGKGILGRLFVSSFVSLLQCCSWYPPVGLFVSRAASFCGVG